MNSRVSTEGIKKNQSKQAKFRSKDLYNQLIRQSCELLVDGEDPRSNHQSLKFEGF